MEAADPTRMEAVLCWTTQFFGDVAELQKVTAYGELWKEHVPTLTNICRRKGMIVKTVSQTPLEAFEDAKAALKSLNDDRLVNGRYAELKPSEAAAGNETEIYKVVVLLLSAVTIYAVEYLEHEDCIELLQKKGLDQVFANVLSLVNNPGSEWWQGAVDSFEDTNSDPCFTANSQDESFGNFEIPAVPSTPRSAIRRNTFVAPHSPIHSAVNSPLTMKKRQDEMRKRMTELADQVDHLQKQLIDSQDQERVHKNNLAVITEKWREVSAECSRQTANYADTEERLREMEKKYADLVKDAKELQTRGSRYKADLENAEASMRSLADQIEPLKAAKEAAVRELRDVTDDFGELQKKQSALEQTAAALERQLESTTAELEQHERERKQVSAICQQKVNEAEEKYNEVLAKETELRAALHGVERANEQLELRLSEEKEEHKKMYKALKETSHQEKTLLTDKMARLQIEATAAETALSEQRATALAYQQQYVHAAREAEEQKKITAQLQEQLTKALQDEEKIKEIRNLERDLSELAQRATDLEEQLAKQRQISEEQEETIREKEKLMTEMTANVQQMSDQVRTLTDECDRLRRTEVLLQNAEIDLRGKAAVIEQLQGNAETLKSSFDLQKAVYDEQYEKERASHGRTREELEEALKTIDVLNEKNVENKKIMGEHEVRMSRIEANCENLIENLANAQAQVEGYKARAEEAERTVEALRQEAAKPAAVPVEEVPECEPSNNETLVSELDATLACNATFNNSELGQDLSHMDMMDDDEESVFHLKSVDGRKYEQVANATTSRAFDFKLDKERVDELKRRNALLHPSQRCSYQVEMSQYESPSASEDRMKHMVKAPSIKSLSLSSMSSQETPRSADNNKENAEATPCASAKKSKPPFARRVSNVFLKKNNK